ncbi:nucleoid-associated protein, YbaB/EbfC family [Candidatus Falkowbacteria bacterium RIFOXYD2_FULL_35_9]|uniref:Nucleoid-associated protein A2478_02985 n=1 Tax=Candidatus Falkowbacteria bacterium RIFOXYC2_FULL_36_12 TaxID=1798002 RepID=A0A1F5SZX5_9BACT|nr:MAG: nucleoid-associated protein, YbaB/EbfC family [Candidatus Falkowbacteria bacterium RIFOXYB2_FULL_35_7]OGF32265.1 MAG: nucleoid-associated protein, YbaB/EbfC family [Candidatus Falkowbacteria bacterium RIFOXYC2_FULL_36_12]OGF47647.1 MAG: nucleoid-associated protein, YbaB/EbfC family [Candidatus Falkowbacteria bacterium RIFOXYD2_FULL_35_9]
MFNKLKNFKELRDQAKQLQSQLSTETAEGSGAWGKVKVIMNGNQEVQSVIIEPEMLADKEKLEGALKEAINDAIKKIQRIMAMKMQQGGFSLPGM